MGAVKELFNGIFIMIFIIVVIVGAFLYFIVRPLIPFLIIGFVAFVVYKVYVINKNPKSDSEKKSSEPSSNKFCSNCGTKIDKKTKFCSNCGKSVK